MLPAQCRDRIVRDSRELYRALAFETVCARGRDAEDVDIDSEAIHILDALREVPPLKRRRIDPASELAVVEVRHTAVRVRRFEYDRSVDPPELVDVRFGEAMRLKINDHVHILSKIPLFSMVARGDRCHSERM